MHFIFVIKDLFEKKNNVVELYFIGSIGTCDDVCLLPTYDQCLSKMILEVEVFGICKSLTYITRERRKIRMTVHAELTQTCRMVIGLWTCVSGFWASD